MKFLVSCRNIKRCASGTSILKLIRDALPQPLVSLPANTFHSLWVHHTLSARVPITLYYTAMFFSIIRCEGLLFWSSHAEHSIILPCSSVSLNEMVCSSYRLMPITLYYPAVFLSIIKWDGLPLWSSHNEMWSFIGRYSVCHISSTHWGSSTLPFLLGRQITST